VSALTSLAAYIEREAARRAKGGHPGMIRLRDGELAELLAILRREANGKTVRR